jgi:hypothetical protein
MTLVTFILEFTESKALVLFLQKRWDENYTIEYCSVKSLFPSEINAALSTTAHIHKANSTVLIVVNGIVFRYSLENTNEL